MALAKAGLVDIFTKSSLLICSGLPSSVSFDNFLLILSFQPLPQMDGNLRFCGTSKCLWFSHTLITHAQIISNSSEL